MSSQNKRDNRSGNQKNNRSGGSGRGFIAAFLLIAALLISAVTGDDSILRNVVQNMTVTTDSTADSTAGNDSASSSDSSAADAGSDTASVSTSYTFRNNARREEHYEKHGIEMGFDSAEAYEQAASAVVVNPESLHKTEEEDGDDVYYLEKTNEFVIVSGDGYLRTYYCPSDGIEYFNRQ